MYGGFNFGWKGPGVIECESWCRVVGGSGERHEITSTGVELVAEGFV